MRLSWGRETSTERKSSSSFLSEPGASFTVNGARAARNTINMRGGVDADIFRFFEVYAQVDGGFAGGGNALSATAGARMTW